MATFVLVLGLALIYLSATNRLAAIWAAVTGTATGATSGKGAFGSGK